MRTQLRVLAASAALSALAWAGGASATTIGVTMSRSHDTFLASVRAAMEAQAKAKGVRLDTDDADDDTGKQISQIQNFIDQKVDAIIVNPVDTSATPKMTALAVAAKIPLVYVNRRPDDKALPSGATFVGSNEKVSGALQGEELVKCMKGKGNLVVIQGQLSNNAARDRTADIEEVAARNPDIKILDKKTGGWDRNRARDLMRAWLAAGTKVDGVAANNDEMAIGAILALDAAGIDPKTVCVGGIDATADGLSQVAKGNLYVTVFQNAKGQGQGAVDAALSLIRGDKVAPYVDIPFEKVTRNNYKDYAP